MSKRAKKRALERELARKASPRPDLNVEGANIKDLAMRKGMSPEEFEKSLRGIEGPDALYVKLISQDGLEFIVKREHAFVSGTIKSMLSGPGQFEANDPNEIHFKEIPSHVLMKICTYFAYKYRYTGSVSELSDFPIGPEIALELLMAANFLDC